MLVIFTWQQEYQIKLLEKIVSGTVLKLIQG